MRLISARQVVLMCLASVVYVFYQGQVYSRPVTSDYFYNLPVLKEAGYYPLWTLIDMGAKEEEPPLNKNIRVWPIQVAPPNPVRFKSWRRRYGAPLLGMPLWNMEELMQGYVFSWLFLSATDPGLVILSRLITDCPSPLIQFTP